jgi:hypothetical protein
MYVCTFKTAQPAFLTLFHLAASGPGMHPNKCVPKVEAWVINRRMPEGEHRRIIMEANVLFWATSIMAFTFIPHFIDNTMHALPFVVPKVRFVHAGIAIVHDQVAGPVTNKSSVRV